MPHPAPARLPLWFLVTNWVIVLGAFMLGTWLGRRSPVPEPQATALALVYNTVLSTYVDPLDPHELADRAIGAIADLDDYSRYVPATGVAEFVEDSTGTYEGIGIAPRFLDDGLYVWLPLEGGPADRAGMQPGDRIDAIDGVPVAIRTPQEVQATTESMRGPAGSTVTLTVTRAGEGARQIAVERAAVQKQSVKWSQRLGPEQQFGYVYLGDFHPGCAEAVARAVDGLLQQGPLRGLVLDLRFDGGGSLDECLAIARAFLRTGTIVTLRRRGAEIERYDADPAACRYPDLPLVLLMNANSASASEVLAGALQDHGRAAVVGTGTYGKGYVNTVFQWKDLDFRLKLTTASYFTPNGRSLDRGRHRRDHRGGDGDGEEAPGGIVPDREVAIDQATLDGVLTALGGHEPAARHRAAAAAFAQARGLVPPGILGADRDPQLQAALEVLAARAAPTTDDAGGGK